MANEPADVTDSGSLFHKRSPATAKDRSPAAFFDQGNRQLKLVDCSHRLGAGDDSGQM